jgi:hypothetical protein
LPVQEIVDRHLAKDAAEELIQEVMAWRHAFNHCSFYNDTIMYISADGTQFVDRGDYCALCGTPFEDEIEAGEPFALTDQHVGALERAIRDEGYNILADPETGEVKLEKIPVDGLDQRSEAREQLVSQAYALGCNEREVVITGGDIDKLQALVKFKSDRAR